MSFFAVLLALVIGAALGMSGAAMQGYTRNPLADPGALGVASILCVFQTLTLLPLAEATTISFTAPIFATILSFFQSRAVRDRLQPIQLVGFMTDSLDTNGCAFALRPEEHVHAISVTFGSFLDSLLTAYRLLSERGVWSTLPFEGVTEGIITATGKTLRMPSSPLSVVIETVQER